MAELGAVTRALLDLVHIETDDRTLAKAICEACTDGLDVDGAALSVQTAEPWRHTLWATDATAALLEDLQFALNEGACVEAATTGLPVMVADLHHSVRTAQWPVFAAELATHSQVGALFALPLQWGTVNLGVLDLYRRVPGELGSAQQRDAFIAANTVALILLGRHTDPTRGHRVRDAPGDRSGGDPGVDVPVWVDGWLDPAVSSRAEIHQATGMVLAQLGLGADDALARLRAHAFTHQRLLIDVARDVIERRLIFTQDEDPA